MDVYFFGKMLIFFFFLIAYNIVCGSSRCGDDDLVKWFQVGGCFCPDPTLQKELAEMRLCYNCEVPTDIPEQSRRIWDFFLLLAVCNTVVVSSHAHIDKVS